MAIISIQNLDDKKIPLNPAMSILNNLLKSGVKLKTNCGGRGRCGRCRIKILGKRSFLSPIRKAEKNRLSTLIDEGWRLACQTFALKDIEIYIPSADSDEGIIDKTQNQ
ncbi:MAG: 2Fe-2S iron-sulfur cluster-binding protein [Spirochaetota bacterium]